MNIHPLNYLFKTFLSLFFLLWMMSQARAQADGGGPAPILENRGPCLSADLYKSEWKHMQEERQELIRQGKLHPLPSRNIQNAPAFDFPIRKRSHSPYQNYYGITNYVDHKLGTGIEDYQCESVSYDGHRGTDYATWPFPWEMMENDEVEVVAAATGVIIDKRDGNDDKSCDWSSKPWNAVYVEHADGSIAWYGHLKKASLTTKALGDTIYSGEYIGLIGSSGVSTGPHLHLELFDPQGNTLDPYEGSCNPTTARSRWVQQPDYHNPAIIHVEVGKEAPGTGCVNQEAPNRATQFERGDQLYTSFYMRDYLHTTNTTLKLIAPNGNIYHSWTHSPNETYTLSWWYYFRTIDASMVDGTWTFTLEYEGESLSKSFMIGNTTSLEARDDLKVNVFPNPSSDFLQVESEGTNSFNYSIHDLLGKKLGAGKIVSGNRIDLSSLAPGLYLIRIGDPLSGKTVTRRFRKE